jgi:hypothetical protein
MPGGRCAVYSRQRRHHQRLRAATSVQPVAGIPFTGILCECRTILRHMCEFVAFF